MWIWSIYYNLVHSIPIHMMGVALLDIFMGSIIHILRTNANSYLPLAWTYTIVHPPPPPQRKVLPHHLTVVHFIKSGQISTKLRSITHDGNESARDVTQFCSVNMDEWYYRISVACDTMELEFILLSPSLVWSTPLGLPRQREICMHQH